MPAKRSAPPRAQPAEPTHYCVVNGGVRPCDGANPPLGARWITEVGAAHWTELAPAAEPESAPGRRSDRPTMFDDSEAA